MVFPQRVPDPAGAFPDMNNGPILACPRRFQSFDLAVLFDRFNELPAGIGRLEAGFLNPGCQIRNKYPSIPAMAGLARRIRPSGVVLYIPIVEFSTKVRNRSSLSRNAALKRCISSSASCSGALLAFEQGPLLQIADPEGQIIGQFSQQFHFLGIEGVRLFRIQV